MVLDIPFPRSTEKEKAEITVWTRMLDRPKPETVASNILFGWLMEKYEQPGRPDWTAFIFGCIAGLFPWIAIAVYLRGPRASDMTPTYRPDLVHRSFVGAYTV